MFQNRQILGCISVTDIINYENDIFDTQETTILRTELFQLLILLARQIDPDLEKENFDLENQDEEKGNGWVTRSVCFSLYLDFDF